MAQTEQQLEVWCAGEEWCPITSTATILGKKWHPVIIHRLLEKHLTAPEDDGPV